jgi:hypothetical protein
MLDMTYESNGTPIYQIQHPLSLHRIAHHFLPYISPRLLRVSKLL